MKEKDLYLKMLEIPSTTCNLTFEKPKKSFRKKKKIDHEHVKESLVDKVNNSGEQDLLQIEKSLDNPLINEQLFSPENNAETAIEEGVLAVDGDMAQSSLDMSETVNVSLDKKEKKKRWRLTTVGVQLSIICALVLTIFLTNIVYADSGINVFLRSVFNGSSTQTVDNREFSEFSPVLNVEEGAVSVSNGIMTFSGTGSVYPSVNGMVSSVIKGDDGLYSVEITHTSSFKSLITGLDYAYVGLDDNVYYNIPVGYSRDGGVSLCFLGVDGSVISDYEIIDNSVVWAV